MKDEMKEFLFQMRNKPGNDPENKPVYEKNSSEEKKDKQ